MKVTVNDSLIPKTLNAPLDYRSRISSNGTEEDIITKIIELGNPYEGQIVYDKPYDKYYTVTQVSIDSNLNFNITIREFGSSSNTIATEEEIINLFN